MGLSSSFYKGIPLFSLPKFISTGNIYRFSLLVAAKYSNSIPTHYLKGKAISHSNGFQPNLSANQCKLYSFSPHSTQSFQQLLSKRVVAFCLIFSKTSPAQFAYNQGGQSLARVLFLCWLLLKIHLEPLVNGILHGFTGAISHTFKNTFPLSPVHSLPPACTTTFARILMACSMPSI